jgi:integrase
MLAKNIVKMDNTKVYDQIEKYLTKHSYNSSDTERAYRRDIELFFQLIKGKELKYLSEEDMQLTLDDFEDFIDKLFKAEDEEGNRLYQNTTINRKIAAIKGITRYLFGKKIVNDISFLEIVDSLPKMSKHYGVLESHEVFQISEWALTERSKGETKRLLILFSFDTCARLDECLSMKWNDLIIKEDVVLITGIGKGNKEFRTTISKDFYNELLKLKKEDSETVFNISERRVSDMMARARKHFNIPQEREIVFHSFRKSGATFRYRVTGDILEAKKALNHSSLATTELYIQKLDYGALGAVSSSGKLDMELYKKVDYDVLQEAISQCNKDLQLILNMKIQEILNKK